MVDPGRGWTGCLLITALAFIKAFSITLVVSGAKTGVGSIDPGTGSFQVPSMDSIAFLVLASTKVYASMNVEKRLRPR